MMVSYLSLSLSLSLSLQQRELSRKRGQADPGVVGGGGGGGGGVVASTGPAMANGRASLYRRPKSPIGGETNNNDDSIDSIEGKQQTASISTCVFVHDNFEYCV